MAMYKQPKGQKQDLPPFVDSSCHSYYHKTQNIMLVGMVSQNQQAYADKIVNQG